MKIIITMKEIQGNFTWWGKNMKGNSQLGSEKMDACDPGMGLLLMYHR